MPATGCRAPQCLPGNCLCPHAASLFQMSPSPTSPTLVAQYQRWPPKTTGAQVGRGAAAGAVGVAADRAGAAHQAAA
eukprot:352724-Chlamydomonas_euryale.AAC.4